MENVPDKEGFEDGEVPHVDEEDAGAAHGEEEGGLLHEVEEALVVHPEDDEDPQEEGDYVDDGVDPVLQGPGGGESHDVQDPGLVRHSVQLRHQGQHREPDSWTGWK